MGREESCVSKDGREKVGVAEERALTRRAGVRVPSTSKRQMVSLRGRSPRGVNEGGATIFAGGAEKNEEEAVLMCYGV